MIGRLSFIILILGILSSCTEENKNQINEMRINEADSNKSLNSNNSAIDINPLVKPVLLTPEQVTAYLELVNSPAVSGLRQRLDEYVIHDFSPDCIENSAIESSIDAQNNFSGLKSFVNDYYKHKFFVISQDVIKGDRIGLMITFQGMSNRVFLAVLYPGSECAVLASFTEIKYSADEIKKMNRMYDRYLNDPKFGF